MYQIEITGVGRWIVIGVILIIYAILFTTVAGIVYFTIKVLRFVIRKIRSRKTPG